MHDSVETSVATRRQLDVDDVMTDNSTCNCCFHTSLWCPLKVTPMHPCELTPHCKQQRALVDLDSTRTFPQLLLSHSGISAVH
jgi:hypothetical protein